MSHWMIYGAYGYIGRLIAEAAVRQGLKPVVAGRDFDKIRQLGDSLGLEWRCFSLDLPPTDYDLLNIRLVLNAAGPFSSTASPMIQACLKQRIHYLDITGELDVLEASFTYHQAALTAEICLISGVGFDVAPTDCLARILSDRMPDAEHLEMAISLEGGLSPGTTKTMLEGLAQDNRIRENGFIKTVPPAHKMRRFPFSDSRRLGVSAPWGDVSTAYHSTGIPNITLYVCLPMPLLIGMRALGPATPLLGNVPLQEFLKKQIDRFIKGPDESTRRQAEMHVWAEVRNASGQSLAATLDTIEGYDFTIQSALLAVEKVLSGSIATGAQTPSKAFGTGFLDEIPGSLLTWLP